MHWLNMRKSIIREYLDDIGFIEVETPILHGTAGGASVYGESYKRRKAKGHGSDAAGN